MALSPEVIAAYKAAGKGRLPSTPLGLKAKPRPEATALEGYKPLVYEAPPAPAPVAPPPPTYLGDLGSEFAASVDTSQADVQRALTGYGAGDWTAEEQANRELAARELARVSPETRAAKEAITYDETGLHGMNARGLGALMAGGVGNLGTAGGVIGGVLQKIPHPLAKAVGYGLGAGLNALQIGGSSSQAVEQGGGTPEQQQEALHGGTAVGALSGLADTFAFGKIAGMAGLDKAAAKASLEQLVRAQVPGAAERLAVITSAETAAKAAPLATKALVFAKEAAKTVGVGAALEGAQEYGEEGGQAIVENVALNKPWAEGAHPRAMLGGIVGAATGGVMAGGAHVGTQAFQALAPEVRPGTANVSGTEQQTEQGRAPFTAQGAARNVNLSGGPVASVTASNINDAAGEIIGTAPITQNNATGGVEAAPVADKTQPPKVSEKLNTLLRQDIGTAQVSGITTNTIPNTETAQEVAATEQSPAPKSLLRDTATLDTTTLSEQEVEQAAPPIGELLKPLTKQVVTEAPVQIPGAAQGQETQDLRTAAVEPTIEERVAKFAPSEVFKHEEIDSTEDYERKASAGAIRSRYNPNTGQISIDPRFVTRIEAAQKAGKPELARALTEQLEQTVNHESSHKHMHGPEGWNPAFEQLTAEAATPGSVANEFVATSLPLVMQAKAYLDVFEKQIPGFADLDLKKPAELAMAQQAVLANPITARLVLNELVAGHPKNNNVTEAGYGDYVMRRAGIMQKLGFSDEAINTPIPSRIDEKHLADLAEFHQPKLAPAEFISTSLKDLAAKELELTGQSGTVTHIANVAALTDKIAQRLGITDLADLETLRLAALAHDLGKGAKDEILLAINQTTDLTPEQKKLIGTHAAESGKILRKAGIPEHVVIVAESHHMPVASMDALYRYLSVVLQGADILDSLIGGPGHNYGLTRYLPDGSVQKNVARTAENIKLILGDDVASGRLDPEVAKVLAAMLDDGDLTKRQLEQLTENATTPVIPSDVTTEEVTSEMAAKVLGDQPFSGAHAPQAGTYYTDATGNAVTSANEAAASTKVNLSNKTPDSIVQRAVNLMHTLTGGVKGTVEKVTDTQYKVGDSVYNLEQEGNDYRVVPATGFDENNDVTIAEVNGKYLTKVDAFARSKDEVMDKARGDKYLKQGEVSAHTLLRDSGNATLVARFKDATGKVHPVSVSSLRSLGASISGRPNDTLANKLLNVKDGISYAIANLGVLHGTDLNQLVISDAGPLSDAGSRVTLAEAQSLSNEETQETLDASRRAEALRTLLTGKKGKAAKASIAAVSDELNGELKNNPNLNRTEWIRAELAKAEAAAKNYSGTEDFGETLAGVDPYVRTMVSDEPGSEWVNAPSRPSMPASTRGPKQMVITNRSVFVSPKIEAFLNGLLAKLRIPTAFTVYDSEADLSGLPAFAAESIAAHPYESQFIAVDSRAEGHREHIIYIAKTNEDGTARSNAAMATDLAHEFGHFVQRVSLDFIVKSAIQGQDHNSQVLLAGLLGLEVTGGISVNPLLQYQNMNSSEQDVVDEMFADRLAAELLTAKNLDVEGVTFMDAVSAADPDTFFKQIATILKNLFNKFLGAKAYTGNFNDFMMAMTGRTSSVYFDAVEAGGRFGMIQVARKNRVQFQSNPMQRTSQFKKMLDSRFAKSVGTGMTHWMGLDSELWHMKSNVATWIARTFSGKIGDVMRKAHPDNYLKFVSMAWGNGKLNDETGETGLLNKYQPVIDGLPRYGKTFQSTPQGDAFMVALHEQNSLQAPLWAVPETIFVVEETIDGRKNVALNLRDEVAKIRNYYTNDLYAFQTAEGMKLAKITNYYPFELTRENVMKFDNIIDPASGLSLLRLALKHDIKGELVWEKDQNGQDVQVSQDEKGWSDRKIQDFIDSYAIHDAVDRDPFAGISDLDAMNAKMTAAMGHIGIMGGEIAGASNNATKARKLSAARRQKLMPFSEADVASLIMKRTGEAIKARATDHMWGAWVAVGGKAGTTNRGDFSLMNRQEYKDWVALQHQLTNDQIVIAMGHPNLTDGEIETARAMGGLPPNVIKAMVAARKGLIAEALAAENMDPRAVAAREIQAKLDAALDRNYYSPFSKMDAALANGEEQGDISLANVKRIKEVIIPAMLGRLGQKEMSASWRATQAYVMTAMNVVYLPLMVFSAIAELPQIAIRMYDPILGNGMFKSQAKMLRTVGELVVDPQGNKKKEAATILRAIGLIKESAIESAITTSTEGEFLPTNVKQFNQRFFELTQIKRFTEFERMVAYNIAKDAFIDYATLARGTGPEAAQAQAQADAVGLDVDATLALMGDNNAWINSKNFQDAMFNWVDEANLRPGANTRPARMSDPRFAVIWYLKDFSWAMQARTLTYLVQQSKLQPDTMHQLLPWISAAIPMMIAGGLGAYARDLLTNRGPAALLGTKPSDRYDSASKVVSAMITRSGMLGPMEILYNMGDNYEHRGLPWVGALSPIASLIQEAALTGSIPTAKRHIPGIAQLSAPNKKVVLEAMGLGNSYAQ